MIRLASLALLVALAACGNRTLPGTDIRANKDTEAIADLIQAYKRAMENRDAAAVLALAAPAYLDNGGTPEPADDIDRAELEKRLPVDLGNLEALRLDLTLRRIDVKDGRAEAELYYDSWYRVKTPGGTVPRRDSDIHRMRLLKIDGTWRVISGL